MNNEQNKNVENQEAAGTSQSPPTQSTTQITSEAAAIVLHEFRVFGAAVRKLISQRESEIATLAQENREKLADTLASAPNACK